MYALNGTKSPAAALSESMWRLSHVIRIAESSQYSTASSQASTASPYLPRYIQLSHSSVPTNLPTNLPRMRVSTIRVYRCVSASRSSRLRIGCFRLPDRSPRLHARQVFLFILDPLMFLIAEPLAANDSALMAHRLVDLGRTGLVALTR